MIADNKRAMCIFYTIQLNAVNDSQPDKWLKIEIVQTALIFFSSF